MLFEQKKYETDYHFENTKFLGNDQYSDMSDDDKESDVFVINKINKWIFWQPYIQCVLNKELQIKNNRIIFGSNNSKKSDAKADPNLPE